LLESTNLIKLLEKGILQNSILGDLLNSFKQFLNVIYLTKYNCL